MARELPGMVNLALTTAQFDAYLKTLKMGAWRPSMIVLHNTGLNPHWTAATTAAQSLQLMKNSSVTWDAQGWSSGPHMEIGPNGIIVLASPLSAPGTHSPSWNHVSWGIEMVGDFDKQPFTDLQRDAVVHVLKALYAFLGKEANDNTFKLHKEDPRTTHKNCPGANCGDKAAWLARLTEIPAAEVLDLPHIDMTAKKPVPAGTDTFIRGREGLVLHAYPDANGFAEGYGTQIKPDGTRVQAGETITQEQAEAWQSARTAADWDKVQAMLTRPISDGLATAILSFCYEFNTFKFSTSTFLKKINAGDMVGAANALYQWHNVTVDGKLTLSDGIKKRRKMEIALFLPNWVAPGEAPMAPKALPPPASKPLIGEKPMAIVNTQTINTASIIGAASALGAVLPKIIQEGNTVGWVAAGVLGICCLIQFFLPTGTAKSLESAVVSVIPVAEAILPAEKAALEQVKAGVVAAEG